jgi:hypothetical protein
VQGCHPAAVRLVDGCSGGDQQLDDAPLAVRVPGRRQRPGIAGVVQGRRTAPVDRVDRDAGGEQGAGGVVPEPGRGQVQGRVTPVEPVGQLRDQQVLIHALRGRGRRDPGRVVRQDRLEDGLHASSMHQGPDNSSACIAEVGRGDSRDRAMPRTVLARWSIAGDAAESNDMVAAAML